MELKPKHVPFDGMPDTFNRTSMELKRGPALRQFILKVLLLIEPVWN